MIWKLIADGGFAMIPLLLCSLITWGVIFERLWSFRRLGKDLHSFHLEAMNALLRGDLKALEDQCRNHSKLPTARILQVGLDRLTSKDPRQKSRWQEAMERQRQFTNQELRQYFWLLGTIGSASPFIGLFGTVVGILGSFQEMARTGTGGFTVVAGGISESLIATAAGIIVAVIAVMAYNAFQTRWNTIILRVKWYTEELTEMLADLSGDLKHGA